jgi:glucose/arabinose dehydrogenase
MKRFGLIALVAWALLSLLPARPAQAADELCFAESTYCVSGRFREYWQQNGDLAVFGLPIGVARQELNRDTGEVYLTQWFERNRFELHPANNRPYDVLLGLLGKESIPADLPPALQEFESGPQAGCRWFPVTGHNVCNQSGALGFKAYWESHGLEFDGQAGTSSAESLALFGYPLTTPAMRTNSSGDTVLTQWFERARFEWHPSQPDQYKVLLGRSGSEVYDPATVTGPTQYHAVQQAGWPYALEVPVGMTIEEVYSGLYSPRFMALDPADGSLVVADKNANNLVRLRDTNSDGRYDQQQLIADGFDVMHSVTFLNGQLYAAEERRLLRLGDFGPDGRARQISEILALPTGATDLYGHRTRTVAAGPDGYLYLSIGSSCDVCIEDNAQRATIMRLRPDGSAVEIYASGLRNTVGFDWRPYTDELWGADMGRNNIGATNPSDELNRIEAGKNYGWPYCHSNNQPNPEFNDASRCITPARPAYNFPAHWAPLGFVFYNKIGLPPAYQGDALVAFHGAGVDQVSQLTGYRVSRVRFENGQPVGLDDLVRGWNQGQTVWGRPCGLLLLPDGSVLISDDANGRIYRLRTE